MTSRLPEGGRTRRQERECRLMADVDRKARRQSAELKRLEDAREWDSPWRKWGPYLSERQWGTVREDYSQDGDAWEYFPHDHARSRAYHWGEDGLAGFCDLKQRLCFALALWNGKDPILKERLFGLSNAEGNHGEDVKEYYFYLDSTPTHSYMKWLYKYPQAAFPYDDLVKTNARRTRQDFEYELIDSGVFDDDRYFDVFVEYAKSSPEECFIRITVANRGPETATIHLLPTLWFRNTWRWWPGAEKPHLAAAKGPTARASWRRRTRSSAIDGSTAMARRRCCSPRTTRIPSGSSARPTRAPTSRTPSTRSSCTGKPTPSTRRRSAPRPPPTTASRSVPASRWRSGSASPMRRRRPVRSRPSRRRSRPGVARRTSSTDPARRSPPARTPRSVMRQAFGGLFWTKQYYFFDVNMWLREHGVDPFDSPSSVPVRNRHWFHMFNDDVISMPDKWEYPWYAAWDLAFHAVALAGVDPDFAKHQLNLMLKPRFQHSNGQLPAYEWNFGDVNPPVHAWATLFQYRMEQAKRGEGDVEFLKRAFGKLLINFTWWVNRKDRLGKSVFEGGFLGLDNIGVFDRSAELPTGGHLEQADGTAWMAMFCQNMFEIAVELAAHDASYDDLVVQVCRALPVDRRRHEQGGRRRHVGRGGRFLLRRPAPAGRQRPRVSRSARSSGCCRSAPRRSSNRGSASACRGSSSRSQMRFRHIPELLGGIHPIGPEHMNAAGRTIAALVDADRLRRILSRMLDEAGIPEPLRHPLGVAVARAASLRRATWAGRNTRSPISRPSRTAGCSAGTPTGAARCGSR